MRVVAVLEDDLRRIEAMRNAVRSYLPEYDVRFFAAAPSMIAWLTSSIDEVGVVSLDYDLDATAAFDDGCGSGMDVAAFLAVDAPNCPVLIHSSNAMRAPAMHMELVTAGCANVALCPFRGGQQWAADIRRMLRP